jgi:serine/threonine protein kinase/Tol biopolymer transport system component
LVLEPGTRLGPYEIHHLIGKGGMGVVFQARDLHLKRDAAIKVLPSAFAADAERLRRFEQEAQAASALNHPNIATVYGLDHVEGTAFIAMEYVPGRTLAETIPRHGLNVNQALRYAVQIADALARAHGAGVIHRDLKPANIMVTPDDRVKLLDFGIAKLVHRDDATAPDVTRTVADLTAEGVVVGTTRYMAPEQARGQRVDARADIFSFGAVLYEMITGRYAFQGDSAPEISTAVLRDNPKHLSAVAPGAPRELERIVARCLRKDPERRFQTAGDLKVALEELREESESGEGSVVPVTRRRRARVLLTVTLAALVALALGWAYARRDRMPAAAALQVLPLTSDPGDETMPSLSPDGTQVVYVVSDGLLGDTSDLYVLAIDTGARLRLTSNAGQHQSPRWSPDGKWIAFLRRDQGLFLISPLGGPERKVLDSTQVNDYCWSADARGLIFATNATPPTLQTLDVQNGTMRQIAEVPFLHKPGTGGPALAVSLDGELLATGESDPVSRDAGIVVRRLEAAAAEQARIPFSPGGTFLGIQFLPGREGIIYAAGISPDSVRLYHSALDGSRGERLPDTDYPAMFPTLSANGDRLAFMRTTGDGNLYKIPLRGPGTAAGEPEPFAHSNTREANPNISRDGSKVAFGSSRTGAAEIYTADSSGQNVVRLTSMRSAVGGSPRFSPDGKLIVFDSRQSGSQSDIFVMPAAGGLPRNLSNHPATDAAPTWSRDGQFIYFYSNRSGGSQVWKMRADGTNPAQITRDGGFVAYESIDGATIFYSKADTPSSSLWTAGSNGGRERMLVPTLYRHNLAPTRSGVYLSTERGLGGGSEILFYGFDDQTARTVYRLPRRVALGLSVAPDESWLLFSQLDGSGSDLMLIDNFAATR